MNTLCTETETEKVYSGNSGRILEMLGNGLSPAIVATALGVSESLVSQLLGEESFSRQVTNLRFVNLQASTVRDRSYDSIEDKLLDKLKDLLPMMYKPMDVLRAITVVNGAKRRGSSIQENTVVHNTVVQLTLPVNIMNNFTKTADGHIVSTGDQDLVTIQSGQQLMNLLASSAKNISTTNIQITEEPHHDIPTHFGENSL